MSECPERVIMFTIPFKTPTINHLYWHRGNVKILTTKARNIRKEIEKIIDDVFTPEVFDIIQRFGKIKLVVKIHEDWYTKKGDIKKKDISNREKFLIDSIFQSLNIDDKYIFEHTMKKVQDSREFVVVYIYPYEN